MAGAEDGSLARGQCGFQVFPPPDLDQPLQGPRPVAQSLYVDRLAGDEPVPAPGSPAAPPPG